eukprot:TRINITY_DN15235_c0_g1::TRINITY_DN15235_c0_g1_i1::g.30821::m.30821 TRINITY_DN15235_c0_g1::TRINITY_DN15235_c0_g1_i1::g.30821  ORF type:complete len:193 (+),score=48.13,sp/O96624/ARPC3_DICDI/45.76/6e-46,P21-Arc/PF04062.9/3.9e-57 TRINITY_DN15235_c0_g1_i1:52-579(+)
MVYHCTIKDGSFEEACRCAVLPLKTKARGPAPAADPEQEDIVDEVLNLFRANVLFRNFEVKSPSDRTLIYLTLYVGKVLSEIAKKNCDRKEAESLVYQLSCENFAIPGDSTWKLGAVIPDAKSKQEQDLFRAYFKQAREELGQRVLVRLYQNSPDGKPDKFWTAFAKRKFMNIAL